jgi:hypothetical protein
MHDIKNITITFEILNLIADIGEFKGRMTGGSVVDWCRNR